MASYYDEHNCKPLGDGEQPNHLLHMARLMIDGGWAREFDVEYSSLFAGEKPAPPASKKVVSELATPQVTIKQQEKGLKCPICLLAYTVGERIKELPCKHTFHPSCIIPWLNKTNSCPVCRHELLTDDQHYEDYKKQKARAKQREFELESLHDSMYG